MSVSPRPRRSPPIRSPNGRRLRRAVASAISAPTVGLGGGADRHGAGRVGAARGVGSPHVGEPVLFRARRAGGENGGSGGSTSRRDAQRWQWDHAASWGGLESGLLRPSLRLQRATVLLRGLGGRVLDQLLPGQWGRDVYRSRLAWVDAQQRGDLRPHLPETLVPQERWDSDIESTGDRICPSLQFDPGRVPNLCGRSACRESQFHRIQDGPSGTGSDGSSGGERDHAARVTD